MELQFFMFGFMLLKFIIHINGKINHSEIGEACEETTPAYEKTSVFISSVIERYFSECYIVQLREHNKGQEYVHHAREIPTIDINLAPRENSTRRTEVGGSGYIKFQQQCLVYFISLKNVQDPSKFYPILQSAKAQRRATYSYIFLLEFSNFEVATKFLMEPSLKSYQNRVWTDLVPVDFHQPDRKLSEILSFKFYHFCYYCENGKEGYYSEDTSYQSVTDIQFTEEIFPDVMKNFKGHILRVTAPPAPPLVLISPSKTNPKENVIRGQHRNILEGVANKHNFSYSLYSVPGTGVRFDNGTWNGVIGEILYGRADLGISVAITYARNDIADFTSSVFWAFLVLVSKKPVPFFEWTAIFYPFQLTCWLALGVSTIGNVYLYRALHNRALPIEVASRKKWKSKLLMMQEIQGEIMTNFKAFYMTFGTLLEQGIYFPFNTTPSRMIAIFWMFFGIIITCIYRSKLFAFLISPTIQIPPSSFRELAASDYTWGMKSLGGVGLLFITQSPLLHIRGIGEKMQISTDKYSCIDNTFHSKFTCIIYKAYIDYMIEVRYWKLRHQMHVSDFVTPPVASSWAVPKNSPLLPIFDKMSFRTYEMGLSEKFLIRYQVEDAKNAREIAQASNSSDETFRLNTNFKNDDHSGPTPLGMSNVYGGFFILLFGAFCGTSSLLLEHLKHNKTQKTHQKVWRVMRRRLQKLKKKNGADKKVSFPQLVRLMLPDITGITESLNETDGQRFKNI